MIGPETHHQEPPSEPLFIHDSRVRRRGRGALAATEPADCPPPPRHREAANAAIGLFDGVVMAVAERRQAAAIATLDLRHFAAARLRGGPRLLPRDL